jgi:hypothetical protein
MDKSSGLPDAREWAAKICLHASVAAVDPEGAVAAELRRFQAESFRAAAREIPGGVSSAWLGDLAEKLEKSNG